MKKVRLPLLILAVPLLMANQGGCAMSAKQQAPAVVDTFCLTARPRTWSVYDTADTIRDVEIWNATIERRCRKAAKPRTASSCQPKTWG
jgi:hypothetical protein